MALIVVPKHTWQRITMALPSNSPYFRHDRCPSCIRPNGSQLSATAVKHICLVLADAVSTADPESRIYRSISSIAAKTSRDPRTVMMALAHLRITGLIDVVRHGGRVNVARGLPSVYSLTIPDAELLKLAGIDTEILRRAEEQLQQDAGPPPSWFQPVPENA